jgi:hypothetical protein
MIVFDTRRGAVGVAPGTTTFVLGDASCPADMARGNPGIAVDLSCMNVVRNSRTPIYERVNLAPPSRTIAPMPVYERVNTIVPTPIYEPSKTVMPTPIYPTYPVYEPSKTIMPTPTIAEKVNMVAQRVVKALSPSADAKLAGLGLVLSPYGDISPQMYSEISATYQNYRNHCGPFDPQFNTQGEAGYYYDTPLGGNGPTDFQVARAIGYTPVVNSWVPFQQETWTMAPWVPPNGGGAYGTIGPALRGARRGWFAAFKSAVLGATDDLIDTVTPTSYNAGQAAVNELRRHQDRVFMLSAVSTVAVAGGFLLNVIKDQREKKRLKKSPSYENPSAVPVAGHRRRRKRSR